MAKKIELDSELILDFELPRPEDGHKNTFGTAIICAGSEFMTGAAVLATGAALRSGAGLVRVFSEKNTLNAVSCNEPCALLELRPDSTAGLIRKAEELCKTAGSVLIGPGIPQDYKDMEALTEAFLANAKSIVLDAGVFTDKKDILERLKERIRARSVPAVLTPHIGEFARLTELTNSEVAADTEGLALKFAQENNCVLVLKSAETLVATPDGKLFYNDYANSGLAKGGSGDVLAGLLAGLLAQGFEPYKAACSAVYIHSLAGEAAADDLGPRAMLPDDLVFYFSDTFCEVGWEDDEDEEDDEDD